jgi:alanine racemase
VARPIQATVCAKALRHNYAVAKRTARHSRVYAVVKANGYGHGAVRVARALGANADGFGILEIENAVALREVYHGPVLLLEGVFESPELELADEHDLSIVVHHAEQLRMMERHRPARPLDVFVKVNTGMNRLGFPHAAVLDAVERLKASGAARTLTLMTHFATADGPQGVAEAMRVFEAATAGMDLAKSLANSAALFTHAESHADIVRPGITIYGATPFADRTAEALGLEPAMALTSRLIAIQELEAGQTVGYGSEFSARAPMRLGVVACGYADGYPRHAKSGTPIVVDGVRTRTAGRVSMDLITVDLTPVPRARVGSKVTLWGADGLSIDEVAAAAGTVGYELMCAVAPRVPIIEAND